MAKISEKLLPQKANLKKQTFRITLSNFSAILE